MYEIPTAIVYKILERGKTPGDDFNKKLGDCGYFGVHKAQDICDYIGVSPLELVSGLIIDTDAVASYKSKKIQLRIDLLKSMSDIATNYDEISKSSAITACKFLLSSLYKDTENRATLDVTKKTQQAKLKTEKQKIRLSQEAFEFSKDSFLANLASRCDRETMEKIKSTIQSYYATTQNQ